MLKYYESLASGFAGLMAMEEFESSARNILADRQILAWLLKSSVQEFEKLDIQEIAQNCISQKIQINQMLLSTDELADLVLDEEEENVLEEDENTLYDIRFEVTLPKSEKKCQVLINIEFKSEEELNYRLLNKSLYSITKIYHTEFRHGFFNNDFNTLPGIINFWILLKPRITNKNTQVRCGLEQREIKGKAVIDGCDLFDIIFFNLGEYSGQMEKGALSLLDLLFVKPTDITARLNEIEKLFGITITDELKEQLLLFYTLES